MATNDDDFEDEVTRDARSFDPDTWSLWAHLDESRDHWEAVYRSYWELDREAPKELTFETWEYVKHLDAVAPAMYKLASELRIPGKDEARVTADALRAIRELTALHAQISMVRNRLELEVGRDILAHLKTGTERVLHVFDLITYAPTPLASEYLSMATRQYLLGCDLECLILCRCAIEAALKHEFDDDAMLVEFGPKKKGDHGEEYDYDLGQYLTCARRRHRLTGTVLNHAHQLKRAANDVIHGHPAFARSEVPHARDAIGKLAGVLSALFCGPTQ